MARIDSLLREARAQLDDEDTRALLAHALARSPAWLYANLHDECDPIAQARFESLVARRVAGEPVAYLTGLRGFWRFDLEVGPATLIPRPDTELLVDRALDVCPAEARVCDLGTGSGAIALALAFERPRAQVLATDASEAALAIARRNAQRLGLANVEFAMGSWYAPLQGARFDLLLSNPPYIEEGDPHLSQGDLRFEPVTALASGADGLDAIRELAAGALAHLQPGGWLMIEHGWQQGGAVRSLFESAGLHAVATHLDLEQRERVTVGRAPRAG